jgi:uncharacterized membrane protein YsdA (DUF1294 family)
MAMALPRFPGRRRTTLARLLWALGVAALGMLALKFGLGVPGSWKHWLACWLVAVNVTAFGYYGYDKARAQSAESRVPELVLHGLTAAGGSVGAFAGMRVFRHKTIKGSFRILFWCIVVLQVALFAWIVKVLW